VDVVPLVVMVLVQLIEIVQHHQLQVVQLLVMDQVPVQLVVMPELVPV